MKIDDNSIFLTVMSSVVETLILKRHFMDALDNSVNLKKEG